MDIIFLYFYFKIFYKILNFFFFKHYQHIYVETIFLNKKNINLPLFGFTKNNFTFNYLYCYF